jgi:hypothetical protein
MSSASYVKRLCSEVKSYEESSDHHVDQEKFYILYLTIDKELDNEVLDDIVKRLLTFEPNRPMSCYRYTSDIYLIFDCKEKPEIHYQNGSHQLLCSEYSSMVTQWIDEIIEDSVLTIVKLIEFEVKIQLFAYLSWKMFNNSRTSISRIAESNVSKKEVVQLTMSELIERLGKKGIKWEKIPMKERIGGIYSVTSTNRGEKISCTEEMLDFQEVERQLIILFPED